MRKAVFALLVVGLLAAFLLPGKKARADVEIQELQNIFDKFTVGFHFSTVYRADKNPYFGADVAEGEDEDTNFAEVWAWLAFTAHKDVGWADISAQIAPYYTETISQDVYGLTKDESDFELDQGWIKFADLGQSPFDLTIGRQDLLIEKWFVIADGELQPAALWLSWHYSFPFAVRVDGDFGPFNLTAFWADSNDYYQSFYEGVKNDVEVTGINLHYDFNDNAYVYGGYYHKIDDSNQVIPGYTPGGQSLLSENETDVFDIGFDYTLQGLHLEGEFAYQTGDAGELSTAGERDREAYGYFGRATYTFPVKYSPYIRGQYAFFSGDDDPEDDEMEEYDPMFIGFLGWNQWIQGELVGEAHLPNANKKVALAEVGFSPVQGMFAQFMYLNHKLDENYWLTPATQTSDDDWADEFNILVDYVVTDHLLAHVGVGYVIPDDAAEEIFGDDEEAYFGQVWLDYHF